MQILIESFLLGLVGGIVPGSILTVLLISVMQGGSRAGLRAFCVSLGAELIIVCILLGLLLLLPIPSRIFLYIGFVGSVVLLYFAWQILGLSKIDKPESTTQVFSNKKIFLLAATNAPLYIFWVTVCAPLIWQLSETLSLFESAVYFMIAFELGWSISTLGVLWIFVKSRNILTNQRVMRKVYIGVSLFMAFLALRIFYTSIHSLLV